MTDPNEKPTPKPELAETTPDEKVDIVDELSPEERRAALEQWQSRNHTVVEQQARQVLDRARQLISASTDSTSKKEILSMIQDSLDELDGLGNTEQELLLQLNEELASLNSETDDEQPADLAEMLEPGGEISPEEQRKQLWEEAKYISDNPGSLQLAAEVVAEDSSAAGRLGELGFTADQMLTIANRAILLTEGSVNYQKLAQSLGLDAAQTEQLRKNAEEKAATGLDWKLLGYQVSPGEPIDSATSQHLIDTVVRDLSLAMQKFDQMDLDAEQRQQLAMSLLEQKPLAFLSLGRQVDFGLSPEQQQQAMAKLIEVAKQTGRADIYGGACYATGLSNEQVDAVLSSLPAVERLDMLEAMALSDPNRAYDGSQIERWTQDRADKNPDIARQLEATRQAEDELTAALEQAGGRAAEVARGNQAAEQRLKEGQLVALEELVDINDPNQVEAARSKPLRAFVEGSNLPAVVKPAERDIGDPSVPESMEAGSSMRREWLTYQVAKAVGIDQVPATVLRNTPFGIAAVQEWRVSQGVRGERWLEEANQDEQVREQLKIMAALDVIMRQMDRHPGNWAFATDKKIVIFDNGLNTMRPPADQAAAPANMMRCNALWAVEGDRLPEELTASFRALKEQRDGPMGKALKKCFDTALGDTSDEMYEYMWQQIDDLLENGYPASEFDQSPNPDFREMEEEERKTAM